VITVDQAVDKVAKIAENRWQDWVRGFGDWPLKILLKPPSSEEQLATELLEAQNWAGLWQVALKAGRLPGELKHVTRRVKGQGNYRLPDRLIVPDVESALATAPDVAARYRQAEARHQQAIAVPAVRWTTPADIPTKAISRIEKLADHDWAHALITAEYLVSQPVTGMMIREIAINGVHTKWIEQNATLLLDLIGPPEDELPDGSPLAKLQHVLGLRAKDTRLNVALLCPDLRAIAGGMQRFSATIDTLNNSHLQPRTVLIIENDQPGHTLTTELPGLAVLHGLGDSATILAALRWLRTAAVTLYWGDIDRAGLQIVASLRRAGIRVQSLLMDCNTFNAHGGLLHKATKLHAADQAVPDGLSNDEAALYRELNAHFERTGHEWQLEQEHLPAQAVEAALLAAVANR
jgi:hypothetical protein